MSANDPAVAAGGWTSAWRPVILWMMGAAVAIVLGALALTINDATSQRDRALAAQRHSYDIMILARTLQGTIGRSEASLGRYVISGDQQLGQLYFDDWRRASETIDRLQSLTGDDATQTRHLRDLREAFRRRGNELARTALHTNYGKNEQALSLYYQSRRAPSLRAINDTLDALIADERVLLERRTSQALASVRHSTLMTKLLAIAGVMLALGAVALGWLMMRAVAGRAVARAEAQAEYERAEELAAAVTEATSELRAQEAQLRQVQKMEAIGRLTGGIAHDFNNMLAVVVGGIELAQRAQANGGDGARHLAAALDGAHRATALTRQLLAFARETAIDPEPIAMTPLFADLADLIGRTLGRGIAVTFDDASDGWHIRADRVQLESALLNLAVNARDAMDGRGTIAIVASRLIATAAQGARPAGAFVAITVSDTGCGIAPDVIDRVFEPFFTTKPVGRGTGLGLSQVFGFTRRLGGDVAIESTPGAGTTVTMFLPRDAAGVTAAAADAPARDAAPLPATPSPPDAPPDAPGRTYAILVIEDDPRVLSATMNALAELGHRPVACDDPQRAAALLDTMPRVDLILSDVLMPRLSGPEVIAALPPAYAQVPVLFVTGFAGESAGGPDLGGHPVLRKPFTLAALERAVTAAATRPAAAPHHLAAE